MFSAQNLSTLIQRCLGHELSLSSVSPEGQPEACLNRSLTRWFVYGLFSLVLVSAPKSRVTAAVQAVSVADPSLPAVTGGNNDSAASVISADGRFVLFLSSANNLVTNDDTSQFVDIFLRDRTNHTITLISVNRTGVGGGNGHSVSPVLSADGRYIVFESEARNLVA